MGWTKDPDADWCVPYLALNKFPRVDYESLCPVKSRRFLPNLSGV